MITEYAENGSLSDVIINKSIEINWDMKKRVINEITLGIAFLHLNNVIHRDLKSLNILMDEHYRAKLCDFGLSTVKIKSSTRMTHKTIGTTRWMAPENFYIYALGMVMWEIISRNTMPYSESVDYRIPFIVINGKREKIPEGTPDNYAEMIKKCWDPNPDNRPMSHS
ncbi:kinase-like domain-containing protein [Umbelopsis sp. PMI_123]|nr:kinase-like domain-containing protein [Umbelopsis sp. PMI_123]